MPVGAPLGNQNASKGRRFSQAIDRALANKSKVAGIEALDKIAETLVEAAIAGPNYEKGDPWPSAIMHLADRIEGKPTQQVNIAGHDGGKFTLGREDEKA